MVVKGSTKDLKINHILLPRGKFQRGRVDLTEGLTAGCWVAEEAYDLFREQRDKVYRKAPGNFHKNHLSGPEYSCALFWKLCQPSVG